MGSKNKIQKEKAIIKIVRRRRFYDMMKLWDEQKKQGWKTTSSGYTGYFYWRKIEKKK